MTKNEAIEQAVAYLRTMLEAEIPDDAEISETCVNELSGYGNMAACLSVEIYN